MINLLLETPKIMRRYSFHIFSILFILAFLTWYLYQILKQLFPIPS